MVSDNVRQAAFNLANAGVCHGTGNCSVDGLYERGGSPACRADEGRFAGAPAFGDRSGTRWRIAGRCGEGRGHGPPDAARLGDPLQREGPDGLVNIPSPGVPPKLDDRHKAFLARIVDEGPIPAVDGVVRWRACDLIMRLHEEFGLSVSDALRRPRLNGSLTKAAHRCHAAGNAHGCSDACRRAVAEEWLTELKAMLEVVWRWWRTTG
jgi:hypothetical protein